MDLSVLNVSNEFKVTEEKQEFILNLQPLQFYIRGWASTNVVKCQLCRHITIEVTSKIISYLNYVLVIS